MSCLVLWGSLGHCTPCYGLIVVLSGVVGHGYVKKGGAMYSMVRYLRRYCGIVWIGEALYSVVKLGPVKHCVVKLAKALFGEVVSCVGWSSEVLWSGVW